MDFEKDVRVFGKDAAALWERFSWALGRMYGLGKDVTGVWERFNWALGRMYGLYKDVTGVWERFSWALGTMLSGRYSPPCKGGVARSAGVVEPTETLLVSDHPVCAGF